MILSESQLRLFMKVAYDEGSKHAKDLHHTEIDKYRSEFFDKIIENLPKIIKDVNKS